MQPKHPSRSYLAKAIPLPNGKYQAQYAAPGLVPYVATNSTGRAYEYNSREEAEVGAMRALFGILNKTRDAASSGKPERYSKMTGPEFAIALAEAGLTPTFFAFLYGTSQERVLKWVDGAENCPHPARILLTLFADDQRNIDVAEAVTERVTTSRRPERSPEA